MSADKYNLLTVVREVEKNKHGKRRFVFLCDCGNETVKLLTPVKRGDTKSCGCYAKSPEYREKLSKALKKKWKSGTRVPNGPDGYIKSSLKHKANHESGRSNYNITKESCSRGGKTVTQKQLDSAKIRGIAKIGIPMPPGRSSASPEHWHARYWELKGPDHQIIEGLNLNDLVRKNAHLFKPEDIVWKNHRCRATKGISNLFEINKNGDLKNHSWKGWTIGDKMTRELAERRINKQQDS